jgi:hypothetical protein
LGTCERLGNFWTFWALSKVVDGVEKYPSGYRAMLGLLKGRKMRFTGKEIITEGIIGD